MNKRQREAWLKKRRNYLGASDAAAALGLSKWKSPLDVCLDKWGEAGEQQPNRYMVRGSILEPALRDLFASITWHTVTGEKFIVSPDHYWMSATPDGEVTSAEIPTSLQIKTASKFARDAWGEPGTAEIPDQYYIQVQHEMCVSGAAETIVYVMFADEPTFDLMVRMLRSRIHTRRKFVVQAIIDLDEDPTSSVNVYPYVVPRDDEMIAALVEQEREFWEKYVLPHVEPPDASRPETDKRLITADAETDKLLAQLRDAYLERKRASDAYDELVVKIQHAIGEAEGIYSEEHGAVRWKAPAPRITTDWEALAKAAIPEARLSELLTDYSEKTQGKRRFSTPRWS